MYEAERFRNGCTREAFRLMPTIYKIMFSISIIVMAVSAALFLIYGLNLGTDFTGGSLLEIEFLKERPERGIISERLNNLNLGQISISEAGERGLILKMPEISEEAHQQILAELKKSGELEEKKFDSIGSVLGSELKRKSIIAIAIALVLISAYLAIVFSRVGSTISPLVLALGAIVALIHDLILPIGVFSWLGRFRGATIDAPMIAAALTILGYSINDTVVVYDRIRENIIRDANIRIHTNDTNSFSQIVHKSIKQTLVRSVNTTLTTLFAVIAIYIFGGATLKNFSLALIIGIASGAYSSIFVASPILMLFHKK
ncbi:MAG: protein-export membrane protein SecF [Parcubacteria group bacterium Gr01-1014_2]|nr:MAG: protein-export membrane protein SecF [Parcubacteria group bacterium Gr01-1014_2]